MQEYCSNLTVNGKTFSFYDLEKQQNLMMLRSENYLIPFEYYLKVSSEKKDGVDVKESHISDLMKFPNFPTVSEKCLLNQVVLSYKIFTGVPVVVDLASMRDAIVANGGKAEFINP